MIGFFKRTGEIMYKLSTNDFKIKTNRRRSNFPVITTLWK